MPSGVIHSSDDRGLSRSSLAASFSQSAGVFFGKSAMQNYVTQRSRFATPSSRVISPIHGTPDHRLMLLSPLGERLGEGAMQAATFELTPSPSLFPKGERNMSG